MRAANADWDSVARFVTSTFRADAARPAPTATRRSRPWSTELCARSPEFAALWAHNDVSHHGDGLKRLRHPVVGSLAFEYSAFAVDGRPDLSMIVYNPATAEDAAKVRALVETL